MQTSMGEEMSSALIGIGSLIVLIMVFGFGFCYGWKSSEETNERLEKLLERDKRE